jgi:hypothetical protein
MSYGRTGHIGYTRPMNLEERSGTLRLLAREFIALLGIVALIAMATLSPRLRAEAIFQKAEGAATAFLVCQPGNAAPGEDGEAPAPAPTHGNDSCSLCPIGTQLSAPPAIFLLSLSTAASAQWYPFGPFSARGPERALPYPTGPPSTV